MDHEERGRAGEREVGRAGGRGAKGSTGGRSQVTGMFLNVNGLESKAIALETWLDETEHPQDLLVFVETNKPVTEAPARIPDYTRIAETGTGGRQNRGVELYANNQYHH